MRAGGGAPGGGVQGERGAEHGQQHGGGDQRARGGQPHGDDADQRRADRERRLVDGALVGEGGVDQPALLGAGARGDRAPADAGERPDLRQREPGDGGDGDERRAARAVVRQQGQRGQRGGAGERLDQDDGTLAEPVGEPTGDRRADGVRHGERARGEAAEAVGAGGGRDEQQRAELGHRHGQAAEEGDEDVGRAGQAEQTRVGVQGGHEGPSGCTRRATRLPASRSRPMSLSWPHRSRGHPARARAVRRGGATLGG